MKLNQINDYANVKQPTNSDARLPLRQIVTQRFVSATAIGSNIIVLPYSVDQANKMNFFLYVNGILLTEPDDYQFINLNGYNASSTIELTLTPAAVMPIIALNLGVAVELSPNIANIQAQLNQMTIVGEIKSAMLTEAQFQLQAGANWILANGRSVVGSTYQTITGNANIPDMRATVQRMKDNGAGLDQNGDVALGTYEVDTVQNHSHSVTLHGNPGVGGIGAFVTPITTGTTGAMNSGNAGAETQGKSTVVNFFIRIN